MIRTPSWPSTAVAACASASASARAARKSSRPRRSRPSADSNSAARRISLRTLAKRASPGGAHQHRQVVAGLGHDGVDQAGEGERGGAAAQARQRLGEARAAATAPSSGICAEPLGVDALVLAQAGRLLDRGPEVAAPAGGGAQQPERVGRDPAGGRGERAQQRLVVERVGDRRQQRADVGDLLLGPVAAAADDVGAQPGPLERVLVGVEAGEGAQQHDHRAAVHALVGQLAQARGEEARLGQLVGRGARVGRRARARSPRSSQPSRPVSSISTAGPSPGGCGRLGGAPTRSGA